MAREPIALLNARRIGRVEMSRQGRLAFTYDGDWRARRDAVPLSLSMPLAVAEHEHRAIESHLWGLLPFWIDWSARLRRMRPGANWLQSTPSIKLELELWPGHEGRAKAPCTCAVNQHRGSAGRAGRRGALPRLPGGHMIPDSAGGAGRE